MVRQISELPLLLHMRFILIASATLLSASSCAHAPRATVAMKVSETEAHVGLGSGEVSPGDSIVLFKNQCKRPLGGIHQGVHDDAVCEKVEIGESRIVRVLNTQYSIAQIDPGVKFGEGTVVEKK